MQSIKPTPGFREIYAGTMAVNLYLYTIFLLVSLQLILLAIDVADLLWTQGLRMFMFYKLIKDINGILNGSKKAGCFSYSFGGWILPRAFITVLGNTCIFLFIIFMLGVQMHRENLEQETYRMTWKSALLTTSLIILPIFSTVLFVVANSFWVLEIFININLQVSRSEDFQKKLEDYGSSVSGAVTFAVDKGSKTRDRLVDMRSLSFSKKLFYSLTEVHGVVLVVIWECLVITTIFAFDGFNELSFNATTRTVFCVFSFVVNNHVGLLAFTLTITAPAAAVSFIFYPISIILCFWKTFEMEDKTIILQQKS